MSKVSELTALAAADVVAADSLYAVDDSAGTAGSKRVTFGDLPAILPRMAAPTAKATGTLDASDNGACYYNEGAAVYTLDADLQAVSILVRNAAGVTITPPAGGIFRRGMDSTSAGVSLSSVTVGTRIDLVKVASGEWWVRSAGNVSPWDVE